MIPDRDLVKMPTDQLSDLACRANNIAYSRQQGERIANNIPLIGKCYRARDNYSCPKPKEYWWLYLKVISVDEAGYLHCVKFARDYRGDIRVDVDDVRPYINTDFREISADVWHRARGELLNAISEL